MANLTETSTYEAGIYQLETTDPCLAGPGGVLNTPHQQLANRTKWLKAAVDGLTAAASSNATAISNEATARADADTVITTSMGELRFTRETTYNEDGGTNNLSAADIKGTIFNMIPNALEPTTLNLPALAGVPNGSIVAFRSYGTSLTNFAIVNKSGTNTFKFEQTNIAQLKLEPGDMFILCANSSGGFWNVIYHRRSEVGKIEPFARTVAPIGWLECDGQAVNRTDYPNLFLQIGTLFGAGNGTTTFNLPDLRGEFIRGWDHGKGTDTNSVDYSAVRTSGSAVITGISTTAFLFPGMTVTGTGIPVGTTIVSIDSSTQVTLSANASASGTSVLTFGQRMMGSKQEDAFKSHAHRFATMANIVNGASPTTATLVDWEAGGATQGPGNVEPLGGAETRPRNIALMYCIKF